MINAFTLILFHVVPNKELRNTFSDPEKKKKKIYKMKKILRKMSKKSYP